MVGQNGGKFERLIKLIKNLRFMQIEKCLPEVLRVMFKFR